jgi:hypothetical protein
MSEIPRKFVSQCSICYTSNTGKPNDDNTGDQITSNTGNPQEKIPDYYCFSKVIFFQDLIVRQALLNDVQQAREEA